MEVPRLRVLFAALYQVMRKFIRPFAFLCFLTAQLIPAAPVFAQTPPPPPEITFERFYLSDSTVYISSVTPVSISGSGIGATVYYVLDADPEFASPEVYSGAFSLK